MRPRSRPDGIARLLSGLVRQLELPFLSSGSAGSREAIDARERRTRPPTPPPTAAPPADPKRRQIRLGERTLDYAFRRGRRKTIGFSITANGLAIAAPRWVGIGQVEDAIREREAWVLT